MKVVVTGMIGTYPVGGVLWDYGQYLLGFEDLGCDVYYLEDTGLDPNAFYEEPTDEARLHAVGRYLEGGLSALSPRLARRWHYRFWTGPTAGMDTDDVADLMAEADVLVNVSGSGLLRRPYASVRRRVLIDTDPGWNHFHVWPKERPVEDSPGWRGHTHFFTYAERIGRPGCRLPDMGVAWAPTRPPVALDRWSVGPAGPWWTTVMSWYEDWDLADGERSYGRKDVEFPKIAGLPAVVGPRFQMAVGGVRPPVEEWRALGWDVLDGPTVTASADSYRHYVEGSRGELSVAKNAFVDTASGWFSCRSACYLAAGRPVVLQDTGFSEVLPTGEGLLAFATGCDAVAAVRAVEDDWGTHSAAARRLAEEHLDARRVLADLLEAVT